MTLFQRHSDREYVERIRRFERSRRTLGVLFITGGILCFCLGIKLGHDLSGRGHALATTISQIEEPRTNGHNRTEGVYLYGLGLRIGTLGSGLIFTATSLIILGAWFGLGGRKEKMLIDYFGRAELHSPSEPALSAHPSQP